MITMYGGRLQLVCSRADRTWHVRVVLGPKPEHQLEVSTGAQQLRDARAQAQLIYHDAVRKLRPADAPLSCWDCLQWDMSTRRCCLEIPECKKTGGRYASSCVMFDPAVLPWANQ